MTAGQNFDIGVLWRSLQNLWVSFLSQLPFILIGLLVFAVFLVAARLASRLIVTAGNRTRLEANLARLLSRLASATITILGVFVAAVVIFPAFKPGDLIAGLGITSVAIGSHSKTSCKTFSRVC